ncbi:hypothetical protein E3N88_25302 [Mikania micrantha]|uniref:Membrane protein of ER body-like protein n=1 Tax=Mikania micrantha TaxID=192012 RepID=A0A5N6N4L1_9ASTR|nr:hypothetical protein E3N88_25302 [Mikania micrantha]
MEITEVVHPWEQEQDDELEEGLVARRKNLNQSLLSTTINVGVTNHHQQQDADEEDEDEDGEEEVKDFVQQKVDEDDNEKQQISEFCVYYDTDKVIEKSNLVENIDITDTNEANGNGMHSVISELNGEHQKHEMLFEGDKSATAYLDNKLEISGIEVIKDGDDVITEYDVETVLKNQDTHDLFCPNCNSCITKRVILRKRKRRVHVPGEDSKRSKPQALVSSELNVVSDDNQALNGVDSRLDDLQPPTSNEYDYQRETDVFRCLSCFSIFMPTGDGFRLFRMFGNKSNEENIENSHTEAPEKKRWFFNFLRSEKAEHNATNLNVSSIMNSSMQESNSHTSNGTIDLEKNQLQSDKVTRESNGTMATDSTLAAPQEQLLSSYHIEKESNRNEYPGMFVVKPPLNNNLEFTEGSIYPLQHDGLKLLVPPNVGSLIIDNSQMNQELDITVQTSSPDDKGRTNLSISPPASKLGLLNSGGHTNGLDLPTHLAINGKEQKMDKDSDVVLEVSQNILQNNVEIHLEEPMKVNKNVLTEKQINILANVKNIESINGKDAIITIESKQLDATILQRATGALGAMGTPALQQAVEQGGVTVPTGGRSLDIIKSIVYGGLIELIASLSVVSSAAGGDAATLNVLALGLANVFGGLFVISHDLWDLKNERTRKTEDRYQQLLGQRSNFPLHMAVSLLSYLIFGFLPPIVYGFSFHESNDKDLKLLMVAAASIVCIMILAAGKAYVQSPRKSYFKTIGYHVVLGFMASGVSYAFGGLIIKLLEKMDVFDDGSAENLRIYGVSSIPALAAF